MIRELLKWHKPFLMLFFLFIVHSSHAQFSIDAETGFAFQDYNHVRIPNETGTFFNFNGDFDIKGPVIPFRTRVGYTFGEKNHVFALFAPLFVNYEGAAPRDIQFQQANFDTGDLIDGFYQFNSYRLTYRRDLVRDDAWTVGVGFTAKIRDASVRLENEEGLKDRKDDFGFVPLLHVFTSYTLPNQVNFYLEGDGLAGGPGRAFDFFLGTRIPLTERTDLKAGYRMLEGGANVDDVYNFTLVNFAVFGVFIQW